MILLKVTYIFFILYQESQNHFNKKDNKKCIDTLLTYLLPKDISLSAPNDLNYVMSASWRYSDILP